VAEGGLEGGHELAEPPLRLASAEVILHDSRWRIDPVRHEVEGLREQRRGAILRLRNLPLHHHAPVRAPGLHGVAKLAEGRGAANLREFWAHRLGSVVQPRVAAQAHGVGRPHRLQTIHQPRGRHARITSVRADPSAVGQHPLQLLGLAFRRVGVALVEPQCGDAARTLQHPPRVVAELLVVPVERAALLLPVKFEQAAVAIQMEDLDAFRGGGQHRKLQEVDARLRQHADQSRKVDLGHAGAQHLAP